MGNIKVLLVERAEIFRRGLVDVLNEMPDVELLAICSEGFEATEKSLELNPDIILLDEGIIEISREIRKQLPETRIILIVTPRQESDISQLLKAEANGYIDKDMTIDAFSVAVSRVYAGYAHVSPRIARKLLKETVFSHAIIEKGRNEHDVGLSRREIEILSLVAAGESNKGIAHELCISENTVKGHLGSIMGKMHVHNRLQAAALARELGIANKPEY